MEAPVIDSAGDRRGAPRLRRVDEHGIVSARIRPGADAIVIDVAPGGTLVETVHRLIPGARIELQLAKGGCRIAVRGTVVRCAVARLRAGSVWYRGAVAFDRYLPWCAEPVGDGYRVPGRDMRPRGEREDATPHL